MWHDINVTNAVANKRPRNKKSLSLEKDTPILFFFQASWLNFSAMIIHWTRRKSICFILAAAFVRVGGIVVHTPLAGAPPRAFINVFSLATRGHYELLENFIGQPNVTVFISCVGGSGDSTRHGVPFKVIRKIWQLYFGAEKAVLIKRTRNFREVEPYLDGIDIVIYIKGREERDEKGAFMRNRKRLISLLGKRVIALHALIVDRPHKATLSATKFVEALKGKKCTRTLDAFMPAHLDDATRVEIVGMLRKCDLKI